MSILMLRSEVNRQISTFRTHSPTIFTRYLSCNLQKSDIKTIMTTKSDRRGQTRWNILQRIYWLYLTMFLSLSFSRTQLFCSIGIELFMMYTLHACIVGVFFENNNINLIGIQWYTTTWSGRKNNIMFSTNLDRKTQLQVCIMCNVW